MKFLAAIGAFLPFVCTVSALAQAPGGAGPSVAFGQVTDVPIPLLSVSGRFSSLNPLDQHNCSDRKISGRVVSSRLILADRVSCGRPGHENLLVNVKLANPADTTQMVPGRHIAVTGRFKVAEEDRDPIFVAEFLIGENVAFAGGDPVPPSSPPAFTSYMMCQPPELDSLAGKLGKDLCVQSSLVANLAATRSALEAAARAPAQISPQDAVAGDPDAISCRLDPGISDRHLTDIACARGSYWAWYHAKWLDPDSSASAPS